MTTSKRLTRIFTAAVLTAALSACAITAPKRTPYAGADNVRAINKSILIGHWDVRILNPIKGEKQSSAQVHYREDGTVLMQSKGNSSGMTMAFDITGTWAVEGDIVAVTMTDIKETSGNSVAKFIMPMMGSMKKRFGGKANVYEASANRIVLVSVDQGQGQAQELTRRP